ncbi:MAG TPA: lipoyl(octanoyl) transferase LipB [Candidatus Binataceae bacterium]|nr:lipoyl(octanoyl) transferase LipB [Candidatus Binataceae bacterium]
MLQREDQAQLSQGKPPLSVAWLGTVAYPDALALQDALVNARRYNQIRDTLLLLEHPHVFTLGRGADERFLINPPTEVPIHRVSRGGEVTYHGPGQLVAYPILKLEGRDRDVHRYLRALEQAIVDALRELGIEAGRRDRLTGVWIGTRKIASIGVGIRRWVTFHGLAVNVDPALHYFDTIVPCGIEGCQMTSIAERLGQRPSEVSGEPSGLTIDGSNSRSEAFGRLLQRSFAAVLGYQAVKIIMANEIWRHVEIRQEAETITQASHGDHHG